MSKAEILDEIPKLKPEERDEIRRKLDEVDGDRWDDADDPLTSEEKALLDARLADLEKHPETSITRAEAASRLNFRA